MYEKTTITSKKILTIKKSRNGDSLSLLSVVVLASSMIIGTPAIADSDAPIYNTDTRKIDNVDINGASGAAVVNRSIITEITDSNFNNNSGNGLLNIKAVDEDTANISKTSLKEIAISLVKTSKKDYKTLFTNSGMGREYKYCMVRSYIINGTIIITTRSVS